MTISTDPKQAAVDAAVAAMAANNPDILTAPSNTTPVRFSPEPPPSGAAFSEAPLPQAPRRHEITHKKKARAADVPERLRLALERRAAFRKAMAALRSRGQANAEPIRTALANADSDGITTGLVSHALGEFLDANCSRPGTFLHELSAYVENELVASVYAAPAQILLNLPDDGSPDAEYIRRLATDATTLDEHVFDALGQPTRPRLPTLSLNQTMVPR